MEFVVELLGVVEGIRESWRREGRRGEKEGKREEEGEREGRGSGEVRVRENAEKGHKRFCCPAVSTMTRAMLRRVSMYCTTMSDMNGPHEAR